MSTNHRSNGNGKLDLTGINTKGLRIGEPEPVTARDSTGKRVQVEVTSLREQVRAAQNQRRDAGKIILFQPAVPA